MNSDAEQNRAQREEKRLAKKMAALAALGLKPYEPSNGTEGDGFRAEWCERCARDNWNEGTLRGGCAILGASMIFSAGQQGYPKQWVYGSDGEPRCTAFVPREELSNRAKTAWETIRRRRAGAFAGDLFEEDK